MKEMGDWSKVKEAFAEDYKKPPFHLAAIKGNHDLMAIY